MNQQDYFLFPDLAKLGRKCVRAASFLVILYCLSLSMAKGKENEKAWKKKEYYPFPDLRKWLCLCFAWRSVYYFGLALAKMPLLLYIYIYRQINRYCKKTGKHQKKYFFWSWTKSKHEIRRWNKQDPSPTLESVQTAYYSSASPH